MNYLLKVRELLEKQNLSKEEFAHKIGLKKQTLYNYINGTTKMPVESLLKIANGLDLPIAVFFEEVSGDKKSVIGDNNHVNLDSPNSHNKTNTGSHELEICKERVKALESENKLLREMIEMYKKQK